MTRAATTRKETARPRDIILAAVRVYQWGRTARLPAPGETWGYCVPGLAGVTVEVRGETALAGPCAMFVSPDGSYRADLDRHGLLAGSLVRL